MVVGRELCLFLAVDASRIPAKQRADFVALAVRRAAPFPDPIHQTAWTGPYAAVWYWPRARVHDLLGSQALTVGRFVAESQYTGAPLADDGAELLALEDGFEGRAWKQGRLVADRWWADVPAQDEWDGFLRGAGLSPAQIPGTVKAPVAETPWAQKRQGPRLVLDDADTWLRRGGIAVAALGCLALGFESGAGLRGMTDVRATEDALQRLDQPLTRILDARAKAEQGADNLQRLMTLRAPQGQLAMLAEVKRVMPSQDWRIVQWQQTALDRLEVVFAVGNVDAAALVSAWESSPMFTEVGSTVDEAAKRVTIRARVVALNAGAEAADADSAETAQ